MEKIAGFCIRHRRLVLCLFLIAALVSVFLIPQVSVNYDLSKYLPEETGTAEAITVIDREFGMNASVQVMLSNATEAEAMAFKDKMLSIDGVSSVIWLDDLYDVTVPIEYLDSGAGDYYKDGRALFTVNFDEGDYSLRTGSALSEIREEGGDKVSIRGSAEESRNTRALLNREVAIIMLVVVPLCIGILLILTKHWLEPVIYLTVLGIGIVINMGTNVFFSSVSFITFSMVAVLQLAISMDYSIFFMHRYLEERKQGREVDDAITSAMSASVSSISSSAMTTLVGFLSLLFMSYTIGRDMGIVLAKGIALSFVSVMLLMPVFIKFLNRPLEKYTHRSFSPNFGAVGRFILKFKYALVILVLLVAVPSFLAQMNNSYIYGTNSATASGGTSLYEENLAMTDEFGVYNPVVVVVPAGNKISEQELCSELESKDYASGVESLATLVDPSIPEEFIPQSVVSGFKTKDYSRIIVMLSIEGESDELYAAVDDLKSTVHEYYDTAYFAGSATSVTDIRSTVSRDLLVVQCISIGAVLLIMLFAFRSLFLPVLLVLVIELSIWVNMSIPYFQGERLSFIGYLIISSIQLGATIDYAILISNRYLEFRKTQGKTESAASALTASGGSVLTSCLILTMAGLSYGVLSSVPSISELGVLLGRGAALSGAFVILFLPQMLIVFDKPIHATTLKRKCRNEKD